MATIPKKKIIIDDESPERPELPKPEATQKISQKSSAKSGTNSTQKSGHPQKPIQKSTSSQKHSQKVNQSTQKPSLPTKKPQPSGQKSTQKQTTQKPTNKKQKSRSSSSSSSSSGSSSYSSSSGSSSYTSSSGSSSSSSSSLKEKDKKAKKSKKESPKKLLSHKTQRPKESKSKKVLKPVSSLVNQLLKRWWYALPMWPPEDYDISSKLKEKKLRVVQLQDWKKEQNIDEKGFSKCFEMPGYKYVFLDYNGQTFDFRPIEGKPSYDNLKTKPESQLYELLIKALKKQIEELSKENSTQDIQLIKELQNELKLAEKNFNALKK